MLITIRHARKCGICGPGLTQWFKRHGFDMRQFVRNGIDENRLLATGDPVALRVVEVAHNESR